MGSLKREDDRDEPSLTEKIVMVASAVFTLALIGYMTWQVVALPADAEPSAELLGTQPSADGDVLVRIALLNEGARGLREAEVEVKCGEQPPAVTFTNIPAHSRRDGTVTCPAGTTEPEVSVTYWVTT